MACKNCKKKKQELDALKTQPTVFKTDKIFTWVIITWFFLGCYGIWSIIEKIISL